MATSEKSWKPASPEEKEAVRQQLERFLAHRVFKASPRSLKLLRYIVNNSLEENRDQLKERIVGIEVFERDTGYDTNLDPIVRNAAADLRKRIAQYYHERDHEGEIRKEWLVNIDAPNSKQVKDYGIVARFTDDATQRPMIVASGIGESGVFAAAEFLTNSAHMEELVKRVPKDWNQKNIEVVVATQVLDGKAGAPTIAAVHYW
jgi:hypothetical protein